MFGGLFAPSHLILVLIIALIIFGPGKLPQVGSALGNAIREFKMAAKDPGEADSGEGGKEADK